MCRDISDNVATQKKLEVFKSVLDKVSASLLAVSEDGTLIALTAYAFESDRELALEVGCNDFVTKPVSERTLKKALDKYSTVG